jgi:cytochrome c-type biogenesis protein CcmE
MTDIHWKKPAGAAPDPSQNRRGRLKFMIGGGMMLVAMIYLVITSTISGAQYFITIDELVRNPDYVGQQVRVSGAVIGETIDYNARNAILDFTVAHIPAESDNLALALHRAVSDPQAARLPVHIRDQAKPDLLQHEAQAILSGRLGEDGVFYATELLLKCPSRYDEGGSDLLAEGM